MKQKQRAIYILSDAKLAGVINLRVIQTLPIQLLQDLSSFDALIFTSKNGIEHLNSFTDQWKQIPSYAISEKTAQLITKKGGKLVFTGSNGHGKEFARELSKELKGKKTAFIGAKNIVSNLVDILKDSGIDCVHIPIYETKCIEYKTKPVLEDDAVIIFSSPSTVECFFKNFKWEKGFDAISIGETTAKYFPKEIDPIIADNRSLQSCVEKALSL